MRNHLTKAGRSTCGLAEPKLDHFTDVKRGLHEFLMRTNEEYQKASRLASERNQRKKR